MGNTHECEGNKEDREERAEEKRGLKCRLICLFDPRSFFSQGRAERTVKKTKKRRQQRVEDPQTSERQAGRERDQERGEKEEQKKKSKKRSALKSISLFRVSGEKDTCTYTRWSPRDEGNREPIQGRQSAAPTGSYGEPSGEAHHHRHSLAQTLSSSSVQAHSYLSIYLPSESEV